MPKQVFNLTCSLLLIPLIATFGLIYAADETSPKHQTHGPRLLSQPEQKHTTSSKQQSPTYQRGTKDSPVFLNGEITTSKSKQDIASEAEERKEKTSLDAALVKYTGFQALFAFFMFATAALQVWMFVRQLTLMEVATKDAGRSARAANDSAQAALATAQSITSAERAYVKMSHTSQGLTFEEVGLCRVDVQVKNYGRTPAKITASFGQIQIIKWGDPLPAPLTITAGVRPEGGRHAFLVTNDLIRFPIATMHDKETIAKIKAGEVRLIVLGIVDYIDQFQNRHRAGYGSEYKFIIDWSHIGEAGDIHPLRECNLEALIDLGYNYDRPRENDEGNDWSLAVHTA